MIPYANPVMDWPLCYLLYRSTISRWLMLLLMLTTAGRSFAADPQFLGEYQIKAGFVFNFTRFVEWPENAFPTPASPILVCVAGETPLTDLLSAVAEGKVVNRRAVSIRRVKLADDLRRCNLLFISAAEQRRTTEFLAGVKKTNTLTVGEAAGFAQAGGMINLSIQENKVKVEMNLEATALARLKIDSKLIAVSRLVSQSPVGEAN